jgi:2-alkyl-3-oxoalkanoate reductase
MKVFIAGATGVIGRRLLPMLVEAGHEVTAMTRSDERAAALREAGATPVVCDAFDADGVRSALDAARPEVVLHELTDLPPNLDPRKMEEQTAGNDRIRIEGTRNLVATAVEVGARRVVAQSIAFAYAPGGAGLKSEEDPLWDDAPWPWSRSIEALHELEDTVTQTEGIEGVVLRYGFFYGPGSAYAADGHFAREVRRRRLPIVGKGSGVFSFIHVDDAATATVAAMERGAPGIYNVVDDDPAPLRDWVPAYAETMGAKPPRRVPVWLARLLAGRYMASMATTLGGASNAKAKAQLGWEPRYPSWRQGFREALGERAREPRAKES